MTTRTTALLGSEPVTLVEAKNHLKVDYSTDDDLISLLITAAREHCENYTNQMVIYQRRETVLDRFPSSWEHNEFAAIQLFGPIIALESITYDNDGASHATLASSAYNTDLDSMPARIWPEESWPDDRIASPAGVKITYTGGYQDTADVPKAIKQAMLLLIGDWYENRTDQARMLTTASKRLLDLVRVIIF